jgi:hypothetical protein
VPLYLIIPFGVNFSYGDLASRPSFEMGSPPDLICRPSATTLLSFSAISVPSNVSIKASGIKKDLESEVMIVELSLRMRRMVVKGANGPLMKNMIVTTTY